MLQSFSQTIIRHIQHTSKTYVRKANITNLQANELIIFNPHTYLYVLDIYIDMPDDGLCEGLKHVALLIQAIKSSYVQRQHAYRRTPKSVVHHSPKKIWKTKEINGS